MYTDVQERSSSYSGIPTKVTLDPMDYEERANYFGYTRNRRGEDSNVTESTNRLKKRRETVDTVNLMVKSYAKQGVMS